MNQVLLLMVEQLIIEGLLEEELKAEVLEVLSKKHKHVGGDTHGSHFASMRKNFGKSKGKDTILTPKTTATAQKLSSAMMFATQMSSAIGAKEVVIPPSLLKNQYPIMASLPDDSEGALTLCAAIESISKPIVAFVRLAESKLFKNALEIPLPLRFMFVVLTPKYSEDIDCHEVGRAFSTLMSNKYLHDICYSFESKSDLLTVINNFLDESIVLPPGDWASKNLLNFQDLQEMKLKKKAAKVLKPSTKEVRYVKLDEDKDSPEKSDIEKAGDKEKSYDPLTISRSPYLFGGVINDWKKRFPFYWSDIKDGLDGQVISAALFIFFACLSGAIAFGGVLGETTGNRIGITETIIVSSASGIIWSLLAGCPLIITGVTGPVLLFDQALWDFSKSM